MEETIHKIGRRKTSVARVYLKKGKGKITINKKHCVLAANFSKKNRCFLFVYFKNIS